MIETKLQKYYVGRAAKDQGGFQKGILRASSFGRCIRAIIYQQMGMKGAPLEYEGYMPMYLGTLLHDVIRRDMIAAGVPVDNQEIEVEKKFHLQLRYPGGETKEAKFTVVGHVDGIHPGPALCEIKTLSQYLYQKWMRCRGSWDALWREFYSQLIQAAIYMDMMEMTRSFIWAFNRSNGQFNTVELSMDHTTRTHMKDRLAVLAEAFADYQADNVLPERPNDPACSECKSCSYRFECHGEFAQSWS